MSRRGGGPETLNGLFPQPRVVVKIGISHLWRFSLRSKDSCPTPGSPAQGSSAGKRSPHDCCCENPWGLWLSEAGSCSSPWRCSAGACTDSPWLCAPSSSTGAGVQTVLGIRGDKMNGLALGRGLEGQLSPRQKCWQRLLFLYYALPTQSLQAGASLSLRQPGQHSLAHPGDPLRPCPVQLAGPPTPFLVAFAYKWPISGHC